MWVIEAAIPATLTSTPELHVGTVLGSDDLDGHRPAARGSAQEHLPHPAVAEASQDPVPAHLSRVTRPLWIHGRYLLCRRAPTAYEGVPVSGR